MDRSSTEPISRQAAALTSTLPVGDQSAEDRHEIGKPAIQAEELRGERLRLERAEHEFERGLHGAIAEHGLDPARLEQILDHVEDGERGIAEIGEALPHFGGEQDREAARVAEEIGCRALGCRIGLHLISVPIPRFATACGTF